MSSAEDRGILDVAEEVYLQLKIPEKTGFHVRKIEWFDNLAPSQCWIELGIIRLPTSMMGKLQPEDWKPLIASRLYYAYDPILRRGLYRGRAVKLVGIFLVGLGIVIGTRILLPCSPGRDLIGFLALGMISLAMFWSMGKPNKRFGEMLLSADRKAADLIGKGEFLAVLRKIERLEPPAYRADPELSAPSYPESLAPFPTLRERIKNLSSTPE